jgi:ParB family chromosome partitioning protein
MQDSSAFQYLAIDTIHESTTNPRRTFDEGKLHELAESIRQHGLIQPITVRPNSEGFELIAGARRYRAAQLADLFSIPARIVEIDDAQAQEWQLVENSQRVDVHPYEEARSFQRLLDFPGYDVAALVEKSGKSASHIYARLSLLQLIPEVAEAFTQERITASHANLIARLPQESQAEAFEQCWRKDWQDSEPHLLPAKHLSAWIQNNLYLALADAPFDGTSRVNGPSIEGLLADPYLANHLRDRHSQLRLLQHSRNLLHRKALLLYAKSSFRFCRRLTFQPSQKYRGPSRGACDIIRNLLGVVKWASRSVFVKSHGRVRRRPPRSCAFSSSL